jgi:hypothetical protein
MGSTKSWAWLGYYSQWIMVSSISITNVFLLSSFALGRQTFLSSIYINESG